MAQTLTCDIIDLEPEIHPGDFCHENSDSCGLFCEYNAVNTESFDPSKYPFNEVWHKMQNVTAILPEYTVDTGYFVAADGDAFPSKTEPTNANLLNPQCEKKLDVGEDLSCDEYEDPVGFFSGGEFCSTANDDRCEISNPEADFFELNSEDDMAVPEFEIDIKENFSFEDTVSPWEDITTQSSSSSNQTIASNGNVLKYKTKRRSPQELDDDIAKFHPYLECVICCAQFAKFTLLRKHFSALHGGKEFYVLCCQRKFVQRSALQSHVMRVHYKKPPNPQEWDKLQCSHCNKMCASFNEWQDHMTVHCTERIGINKCLYCSETFVHYSALYKHLENAHGVNVEKYKI
uniref:C2H2-type domain-containing protein n=1 Tax=Stomoxys calcitrans TaxID=35570 RepID=A0A1I8QCV0_STOCA